METGTERTGDGSMSDVNENQNVIKTTVFV